MSSAHVLLPTPLSLSPGSWRVWSVPLACLLGALAIATPEQNQNLFLAFNTWAARGLEAPWEWLTALGDALTALCILLLFAQRRPDIVLATLAAALLATLATQLLKEVLDLPRPFAVLGEDMNVIGKTLRHNAFPSGHAATAFTLTGVLAAYVRPRGLLLGLLLAAALVGLSRIAVGAHWPLDVLGGAVTGWLCGLTGVAMVARWGWAERPRVIAGARVFLLACALALLFNHDSGYPQADWLEKGIALAALTWSLFLDRATPGRPQAGRRPQTANRGSA